MNFSPLARLKNSSYFVTVFLLLAFSWGLSVQAADSVLEALGASGSIRPSYWHKDKSFSSAEDFFVGSLWLTLRPPEISGYRLYFDSYLIGGDLARTSQTQGDIREAYVEKSFGSFDLKVGRQIVVWGRADKLNPTDSFSTKDLTQLMTDDEDQRKGQGTIQAAYNFNTYRLIAIWQPEWRVPKYPIAPQTGVELQSLTPENSQKQWGLKLDSSGGDWDWSVSYFDGYNKTPDLVVLSAGALVQLGLDYAPVQVYGADLAQTIGVYGVRAEAAYTKTSDDVGRNPFQQNSNLFLVVGADRTVLENLNVNAQILYRYVFNYEDPSLITNPNTKTIALQQSITSNQIYQEQVGISFRPSYKALNETLELEVAFVTWLKNSDSLIKPKLTYAISDSTKFLIGAEFYNGPQDTFFGRLKDNSSVFSEFRYLF